MLKKLFWLALGIGLTVSLYFFIERDNVIEIPLSFNSRNIAHVPVDFGGYEVWGVVDTGTRSSEINPEPFPKANLVRTGKFNRVQSVYSETKQEFLRLDKILIGEYALQDVDFLDQTGNQLPIFYNHTGTTEVKFTEVDQVLLGNSIFENKVVLFDYPNKKLWIGSSYKSLKNKNLVDDSFKKYDLFPTPQHFALEVFYQDQKKIFAFDTGCTFNIIFAPGENAEVEMINLPDSTIVVQGDQLQIGKMCQLNRPLPGLDGFLGASFFWRNLVCIDCINQTVWIKPLD